MTTVVLLGFSCAGKSSVIKRGRVRWTDDVVSLDSDQWAVAPYWAPEDDRPHVYRAFINLGRAAVTEIEAREGEFLDGLRPSSTPRIVAAGPALPRRPEWLPFVERVQPRCVYLTMTPEEVLHGLRDRRHRHMSDESGLVEHPNFGSWDDDVTTRRSGDRWVEIDDDAEALANIRRHMELLVQSYEEYTPDQSWRIPLERRCGSDEIEREFDARLDGLLFS